MLKRLTVVFPASLILAGILSAQTIQRVPVHSTSASSGKEMFAAYCAACHGAAGKGDGPAAAALKKPPTDLTQLTRKNNGKFPVLQVRYFIMGDRTVAAHGTRDMPAWGEVLHSLRPSSPSDADMRIHVLEDYIESFQAQ